MGEIERLSYEELKPFRDMKLSLEIVAGVEGPSAYLLEYRIGGPKPWGGGRVSHAFKKWRPSSM